MTGSVGTPREGPRTEAGRTAFVEELAVLLNRHGVAGWVGTLPMALARAIVEDMLATRRCDVQEDNVRGDMGGPCRKLRDHEGDHDPFERLVPDSLRATFALDPAPSIASLRDKETAK